MDYTISILHYAGVTGMKPILESNESKALEPTGSAPEIAPKVKPRATSAKPVFSLSNLKVTKPRTATDIRRAIDQGRVAELKPD